MSTITRTVYGARIQTELLLGLPHTHIDNTTLNEKFDVQARVMPSPVRTPILAYFGIGMGGFRYAQGAENNVYPLEIQHSPTDAAAYRHIPFLLRQVGNDIVGPLREQYAMRRLVQHNGTNYIGYYLRKLNRNGVIPQMLHNVPDGNGGITSNPFIPNSSNLNPVAPPIPPVGSVTTDGSYMSTSATIDLSFSEQQVDELLEVGRILYDDPRQIVLSEFVLVAGVEQVVTSSPATGSVNYLEALQATVVAHATANYAMAYLDKGLDHSLELGAIEPLTITALP